VHERDAPLVRRLAGQLRRDAGAAKRLRKILDETSPEQGKRSAANLFAMMEPLSAEGNVGDYRRVGVQVVDPWRDRPR
jgi:hypothetical protein